MIDMNISFCIIYYTCAFSNYKQQSIFVFPSTYKILNNYAGTCIKIFIAKKWHESSKYII